MPTGPTEQCPECGARVPSVPPNAPTHAYLPASAGCWALFGEIQADELTRFRYPPAHRLVVDAYCAQHPGDGQDRRVRQSLFVHLVGLCAVLERGADPASATSALRDALSGRPDFPVLRREGGPGALDLTSMLGAVDLADYTARARTWAAAVWAAWSDQQPRIRAWLDRRR